MAFICSGEAIWCYRCTSATPGCAETFNWRGIGYWGEQCPEDNDICVKITERKRGKYKLELIIFHLSLIANNHKHFQVQ